MSIYIEITKDYVDNYLSETFLGGFTPPLTKNSPRVRVLCIYINVIIYYDIPTLLLLYVVAVDSILGNIIGVRRVLVHVTLYKYYCCCCYKRFAPVQYPNMHDLH